MIERNCEDCGKAHTRRSVRCAVCAKKRHKTQQSRWMEENHDHREYMRNWREKNLERNRVYGRSEMAKARRRERWRTPEGRARGRAYAEKRYQQVDQREKRRARNAVTTEIRAGRLMPPKLCEECNGDPGRGVDGRRLIRADHHLGYDKLHWLAVRWICIYCDGKKERISGSA